MKKWFLGLCAALLAHVALADQVQLKDGHPDVYYVKKGDTLWDISNVFLKSPWLWPEIWHVNPQIENPHLIFPEDKLSLVFINGEKKITVVDRQNGSDTMKLSPNGDKALQPRVRISAIDSAIPAIPLEKINAFLSKSRVSSKQEMNAAPYVIAGDAKHLLTGPGDKLYARGDFQDGEKIYGFFRPGRPYVDPETKEILGLEAKDVGEGRIIDMHSDVATVLVNRVNEEVRINDRLLPSEQKKVTARFIPHAPEDDIEGTILQVQDGSTQFGPWDVVALNIGERDDIEVGHILAISQRGEIVKDKVRNQTVQLPDTRAGLLMVFRTFEKMSFGLVLQADRPLAQGDKVHTP